MGHCIWISRRAQSSQRKHFGLSRPRKTRQVQSNVKVLLTLSIDYNGVVHYEFLPEGCTVNKEYNHEVMCCLCKAIQKNPELWKNQSLLLQHNNMPAHTSLLIHNFLVNYNTILMPQPPYSPDLAHSDFFLVLKLKRPMKGRGFTMKKDFAGRAQDYTKKCLSEVLQGFEKTLERVYYIWGGLFRRGQYRYWWINKYFSRKIKILFIFWTAYLQCHTYFILSFHSHIYPLTPDDNFAMRSDSICS